VIHGPIKLRHAFNLQNETHGYVLRDCLWLQAMVVAEHIVAADFDKVTMGEYTQVIH